MATAGASVAKWCETCRLYVLRLCDTLRAGLPDEDLWKLQYALNMCATEDLFDEPEPLEAAVAEAGLRGS